ncbi:penicillin acylase family protein, partial [Streptococcus pyogenes]
GYGRQFGSFTQTHGPGYRAVFDLTPDAGGWFIHGTGQSGNLLSPRYSDYLERWRDNRMVPVRMTRAEAEQGSLGTLTLRP